MTPETTSTVSFEYRSMNFTAHLTHMTDPVGRPHVEIDRIVHDDTGEEVEDEHVYIFFIDNHCPPGQYDPSE